MKETEYEKIIAELVKFMNKLPHQNEIFSNAAATKLDHTKYMIQNLIKRLDVLAELDALGWLK